MTPASCEGAGRTDVLVLYDDHALATEYVRQHVEAMARHSRNRIHYSAATGNAEVPCPLENFDAIVIHFSVRIALSWHLSPTLANAIAAFTGAKILMIQDEYDLPERACAWIRQLGIQHVFTCTPVADRDAFYPQHLVPGVTFTQCLTGYLPDELPPAPPIAQRPIWLGYRGRKLPIWYGKLAAEKHLIAGAMANACRVRGIPHDIRSAEEDRLTGVAWFKFLGSCRAVLGTESGANVVDRDGSIRVAVEAALKADPTLNDEVLYERFVRAHDDAVHMNQISPKIFEAVALGTALVLYDGDYSGLIEPGAHYISLRKDHSNIDEVCARLADVDALQAMTARAQAAIGRRDLFGYGAFVAMVDDVIDRLAPVPRARRWSYVAVRCESDAADWRLHIDNLPSDRPLPAKPAIPAEPYVPLTGGFVRRAWLAIPSPLRAMITPRIEPIIARLRRDG